MASKINSSLVSQMYARVADQQSGWQRTIPMVPQTAFTGNSYFAMATLDLCQMETLVNMVEKETGLRTNTYIVEIIDNVSFTADASGQVITDTFNPVLAFKYDKVHLYLANNDNQIDSMHTTKQGLASSSNIQANILTILGRGITVGFIRVFALAGLGISISVLVIMGLFLFNTARQSEESLIRLRYGSILMDIYERSLNPTLPIIDVTSIDDLAKMAERQNTMILHMSLNFVQYYLVQGNGVIYRYTTNAKKEIPAKKTIKQEIPEHIAAINESIHTTPQVVQRQSIEYVINTGKISVENAYLEETEILRKISI